MFISKNLLDNPNQRPAFIDQTIYKRAGLLYKHFDDNQLWYVDEGRSQSHVFFDGTYFVEISPKYVRFLDNVKLTDFQMVDVHGTNMVRYKRSIKPMLYHPMLNSSDEAMVRVEMTPGENLLFTAHPGLVKHCIYNRCCGWTIDMCNNTYPLITSLSASIHTCKVYKWLKTTYNIVNPESKTYRRRVCSLRFTLA